MNVTTQFCDLFSEIKAGYPDLPYHTAILWLHSGHGYGGMGVCVCLCVIFELELEIELLLTEKISLRSYY